MSIFILWRIRIIAVTIRALDFAVLFVDHEFCPLITAYISSCFFAVLLCVENTRGPF